MGEDLAVTPSGALLARGIAGRRVRYREGPLTRCKTSRYACPSVLAVAHSGRCTMCICADQQVASESCGCRYPRLTGAVANPQPSPGTQPSVDLTDVAAGPVAARDDEIAVKHLATEANGDGDRSSSAFIQAMRPLLPRNSLPKRR